MAGGNFNNESLKEIMAESSRLQNLKNELSKAILDYNNRAEILNLQFSEWSKLGMHLQNLVPLDSPITSGSSISTTPSTVTKAEVDSGSTHNDNSRYFEDIPNEFFDPWDGTSDSSILESSGEGTAKPKPRGRRSKSKNAPGPSRPSNAPGKIVKKYGLRSTDGKFVKAEESKNNNKDNDNDAMNDE